MVTARSLHSFVSRSGIAVFALIAVGGGLAAGCSTTESVSESSTSFHIDVPAGKHRSILDTQLKVLNDRAKVYPKRADLQYRIAAIHAKLSLIHI